MNTAPPKKGMSTTTIVLIIVGVVVVLGGGTCAVGALFIGREVKQVEKQINAEGGVVMTSPPEVVAGLAGPKKDYVGAWVSESGKSSLVIEANGGMSFVDNEGAAKETVTLPIAAFNGNDFEAHMGLAFKVPVSEPPHQVNGRWEMTARKIHFHR